MDEVDTTSTRLLRRVGENDGDANGSRDMAQIRLSKKLTASSVHASPGIVIWNIDAAFLAGKGWNVLTVGYGWDNNTNVGRRNFGYAKIDDVSGERYYFPSAPKTLYFGKVGTTSPITTFFRHTEALDLSAAGLFLTDVAA